MKRVCLLVILVWFIFVFQVRAADSVEEGMPGAVSSSATVAAQSNIFMWKVNSKTATVYLLGSVHYAKEDLYPLNPRLEKAYESADIVTLEIDPGAVGKEEMELFKKAAVYAEGDCLDKHISAKTLEMLKTKLKQLQIPYDAVKNMQPWAVSMELSAQILQQAGFNAQHGIDAYFYKKAKDTKPIFELESFAGQIELLSGSEETQQELLLAYTLAEAEMVEQEMDSIFKAWITGDVQGIEKMVGSITDKYPDLRPLLNEFFAERNKKMAECVGSYLKSEATYFVIVGAGHLVGENGILELLRKKGYVVKQQ